MNCYQTVDALKSELNITTATDDGRLLALLIGASRAVEGRANRKFFTEQDTRYFGVDGARDILVDEYLSLSEVTVDTDLDLSYATTWEEDTDYQTGPANTFPKWSIDIRLCPSSATILKRPRYIKATGVWGAGDMRHADPWKVSGITGTVADGSTTTLAVSAEGTIQAGHTLRIEGEQVFVTAATTDGSDEVTVERGVNGTTAAAHSAKACELAQYPADLERGMLYIAADIWRTTPHAGMESEKMGDYSYKMASLALKDTQIDNMLSRVYSTLSIPL